MKYTEKGKYKYTYMYMYIYIYMSTQQCDIQCKNLPTA